MLLEQIDKKEIDKVIAHSQNIANPMTQELLEVWSRAKRNLSHKFLNDKVSYTHPEKIQFELNEDAKEERLCALIEYINNLFNSYSNPLSQFLQTLSTEEFYSNTLEKDYILDFKENKKISKGSKVIKSFKYFIEDEKLLHDLQDKASIIIQENKVSGYLTFSIHPLDFLSSSENTYNWRSCHALDGEYRAGNLSYMCDPNTMIVYLAPEEKAHLPHFPVSVPWNNKKWRVLLHFSDNLQACFAGRQYPFFSPGALGAIYEVFYEHLVPTYNEWFTGAQKKEQWSGWLNDYITSFEYSTGDSTEIKDGYCVIGGHIYDIYSIVKDAEGSKHFNDVIHSSCYNNPYYMFQSKWHSKSLSFTIGSAVKCVKCGENFIDGDDSMMCHRCECEFGDSDSDSYRTCDCCGTRFWYEDGQWVGEDDFLCPSCVEKETFSCEACRIRTYNSEQHWDEKTSQYICNYCFNERNE